MGRAPHTFHLGKTTLHIGLDDTDSPRGMCTTYLGFMLVRALLDEGAEFLDYPRLVRLNPNIPWKTRGNGAVGLTIRTSDPDSAKKKTVELIRKNSEVDHGANPAVVFYDGEAVAEPIRDFSRLALWQLVRRSYARRFVRDHELESFYIGNGQGLVGAVGAIGYEFDDATLELLSYRRRSRFGTPRNIPPDGALQVQRRVPGTFNSYDEEKRRMMIAPRGPDPVLYGIRGEDPDSLLRASSMIRITERIAGYLIFKSNQGTADHLRHELDADDLRPYMSGMLTGIITGTPAVGPGGHVFFKVDANGAQVSCAAYKESGLAGEIADLIAGDRVIVGGGIRPAAKNHTRTLNVEFLDVTRLSEKYRSINPLCTLCQKRMKSKGRGQGFKCARCGRCSESKESETVPRKIRRGMHIPTACAQRHLTRPASRRGVVNAARFDDSVPWFHLEN